MAGKSALPNQFWILLSLQCNDSEVKSRVNEKWRPYPKKVKCIGNVALLLIRQIKWECIVLLFKSFAWHSVGMHLHDDDDDDGRYLYAHMMLMIHPYLTARYVIRLLLFRLYITYCWPSKSSLPCSIAHTMHDEHHRVW